MAIVGPSAMTSSSGPVTTVPISRIVSFSGSSPVISKSSQMSASFFIMEAKSIPDIIRTMSKDFVFTMKGLSKTYPPGKQVLKDIYLSFYYGAKIGVIGLNGAGKSTLLKIMAGVEKEFDGDAFPGKGVTVGYLSQEPKLDEKLSVKENVSQGMKQVTDLLAEYEKVSASFTDGMNPDAMEKALNRQSELQEKIEAANGWE